MSLPCLKLSSPLFAAEPDKGGGKFHCFGASPAPSIISVFSACESTHASATAATRGVWAFVPSPEGQSGRASSPLSGDNHPSHPRGASCQEAGSGLVEQAGQGGWHRAGPGGDGAAGPGRIALGLGGMGQQGQQDGNRASRMAAGLTPAASVAKAEPDRAEPALPFVAGCGAGPQSTGGLADLIIPVLSCCRCWEPQLYFPL